MQTMCKTSNTRARVERPVAIQSSQPSVDGPIRRWVFGSLLCVIWASVSAQTEFEDVSRAAGFVYEGESWGASWGDLDGDGWPDLFVNHHRAKPALHMNERDGSLRDITASTYWANPAHVGDMHGGAWGDFDNDGDQDFYVTHGSKNQNHFMVNQGGSLVYSTPQYDPQYSSWRGRLPIWFDFTHDGLLDTMVTSENRAPILEQVANTFVDRTGASGIQCDGNQMGFLADVNADGTLDFICSGAAFPGRVYDFRLGMPFTNITGQMPKTESTQDVAIADFDGDLRSDFFMVRGAKRLSGADKVGNNKVAAQLITNGGGEKRAHFVTNGNVTFTLVVEREFSTSDVSIGSGGWHPNATVVKNGGERTLEFTLSSSDPNVVGIAPHDPRNSRDVFIGYDPATETWTLVNSPGGLWTFLSASMTSTAPVSNVTASGLNALDRPMTPRLVAHKAGGFSDVTSPSGLSKNILCVSTAAADFDNDMDVDLYAVCRGANLNVANMYFQNDGSGKFSEVPMAAGAAGPTGPDVGKGESVVTADYDVDGHVDLFVTNGLALNPEGVGGPDLLFRNTGHPTNKWIQLDLVGTLSNRDGIGARVLATAAGKTQLREQGGGYHRWSQNDKRLHFGLGNNSTVNLVIEWPSGVRDTHYNVAAGSVYTAREGGAISVRIPGQDPAPPDSDLPVISIGDASVTEQAGGSTLVFNVTLDKPSASGNVSVQYRTNNQTAMAGGDYVWENGTVVFPPGETSANIGVAVVNDDEAEDVETMNVELSNPSNGVLGTARTGIGTIHDDDAGGGSGGGGTGSQPLTDWVGHTGGVTTSGNTLAYSGSPEGWFNNTVNSVPMSALGAGNDFEVFWTLDSNPAGTIWVMGLGIAENNAGRSDIDFGLRSSNGQLTIYESGIWRANGPAMSAGDVVSIRVSGSGLLEYLHNGVVVYTSSYGGAPDFYIDTSFKQGAASFRVSLQAGGGGGGGASSGDPVAVTSWINHLGGVDTDGNDIAFANGQSGWQNTVNSMQLSALGFNDNYELRWEVSSAPNGGNWMIGLGVNETDHNWRDIEYGFRILYDVLRVYESGTERENVGPQEPGDVLTIRVSGTTLEYRVNGALVHSRPITGSEDFYIDTSFKDGQATMVDFTVSPL